MTIPIGLQLYTIKDETAKDFLGTIRKVGQIGYDGVEFAGYFDTPAAELKQTLVDSNLQVAGTHLNTRILRNDLAANIDYCQAIDCPAILCPSFKVEERSADFFKGMADFFNETAQTCKDNDLGFAYHIHGHEFIDFGGQTGMDILFENTDPSLVYYELDTYWVEKGGADSLALFKANADRCSFIHFKDMKDRIDWHDTEIGDGLIDVAGIIAASADSAVEWFVVEQEAFDMPVMDSIVISLKNLRQMTQA